MNVPVSVPESTNVVSTPPAFTRMVAPDRKLFPVTVIRVANPAVPTLGVTAITLGATDRTGSGQAFEVPAGLVTVTNRVVGWLSNDPGTRIDNEPSGVCVGGTLVLPLAPVMVTVEFPYRPVPAIVARAAVL